MVLMCVVLFAIYLNSIFLFQNLYFQSPMCYFHIYYFSSLCTENLDNLLSLLLLLLLIIKRKKCINGRRIRMKKNEIYLRAPSCNGS